MSTLGPDLLPTFSPMIEHRRFVHLALADDDGAVDRKPAELAAHCVDSGAVGFLLEPPPAQPRRGDRRKFGHPRDLDRHDAFDAGI